MNELEKAKFIFDNSDVCRSSGDCELTDCENCCEEIWNNAINEVRADERSRVIEEFFDAITSQAIVCNDGITEVVDVLDIINVKEQLKSAKQ